MAKELDLESKDIGKAVRQAGPRPGHGGFAPRPDNTDTQEDK